MDLKQAMKENGFFLKVFYDSASYCLWAKRGKRKSAEYKAIGSGGIGKAEVHALS